MWSKEAAGGCQGEVGSLVYKQRPWPTCDVSVPKCGVRLRLRGGSACACACALRHVHTFFKGASGPASGSRWHGPNLHAVMIEIF